VVYAAAARRVVTAVLRHIAARKRVLRFASAHGRGLVLVYHRISPEGPARYEVVPSLPSGLFRQQLEGLAQIGEIVPLPHLLEPWPQDTNEGPRFAITFDDDSAAHVRHALPVLQDMHVHATFFLSGRALNGLPPYWWTYLEQSIRSRGVEHTRLALGLDGNTPVALAIALEASPLTSQLTQLLPSPDEPQMGATDVRTLAEAGMGIGFHTLHHSIVSELAGHELDLALTSGRNQLAAVSGTNVELLAYPHGRANLRAAAAAERAGFRAAFVTGGRPVARWSDAFLLGRWEPPPLPREDFLTEVALRLMRAPTPPRRITVAATIGPYAE
jgi:peptidoglycan/xylan/chitin deacetylase (PgdA/CDA1 family)